MLKVLSKDPTDRYPDADELSGALGDALAAIEDRASLRGPTAVAVRCSSCGALNPASQKFCGECGSATTSTQLTSLPTRRTEPAPPDEPKRPATEPPSSERPVSSERTRPGALAFIGREDDLAWLETRRGEARIALRRAHRRRCRRRQDAPCPRIPRRSVGGRRRGRTDRARIPRWAEVGYWALKRAIVRLAALPESGGASRDWVAATAGGTPRPRPTSSEAATPPIEPRRSSPDERRFAAAEALRWAFVRASERARGHRVVLAVDDLHCVDGASRNAFADALSDPPLVPALLIATYAPGFDPGWPSDVSAARVLTGLPTAEVARAIARTGRPSAPAAQRRLGPSLPLYLEQLLRYAREESGGAPAGLADVIAVRVERLPADARRVLQAAAVWGDDGDDAVLTRMLGDEVDLIEALGFLRRAGMVVVGQTGIRTSHPLLREVTLATIPAAVKRELHAVAARRLRRARAPHRGARASRVPRRHAVPGAPAPRAGKRSARGARGDHQGAIMALRRGLELARRELFRGELDDPMRAVLIFSRKLGEALVARRPAQRRRGGAARSARRGGAERQGSRGRPRGARACGPRAGSRARKRATICVKRWSSRRVRDPTS